MAASGKKNASDPIALIKAETAAIGWKRREQQIYTAEINASTLGGARMAGKARLLAVFAGLLCLGACAPQLIPQEGDLGRAEAQSSALKSLLERGVLDSKAGEVHLDVHALPPRMRVDTRRLSPEQYDGIVHFTLEGTIGDPKDDFSYYCENITQTAVEYTTFDTKTQARETENYKLTLREGGCVRIQGKKIDVRVGIDTFDEPLSVQQTEIACHSCMESALKRYSRGVHVHEQNDTLVWEDAGMLVGEGAGSVWYDASSPIPNLLNLGGPGDNYYQLVLVGERFIVAMDFIYPLSMSLTELQAEALPIVKALRYTNSPGTPKQP